MGVIHDATGLAIEIGDPLKKIGRASHIGSYASEIASYNHVDSAFLGYDRAEITINVDLEDAEEWFQNGIGRDIRVTSEGLEGVWEGFVDEVEVTVGNLTVGRGPLLDIANRVMAVYAPLDVDVYPPVAGDRAVTTIVEDTISQDKYGIVEKVISVGTVIADATTNEAERQRDIYLAENKEPETTHRLSGAPADTPSVRLSCLGYGHWLGVYIYDDLDLAEAGYIELSNKIVAILGYDPNGFFSGSGTDYSGIEENAFLTFVYENDQPTGMTAIKEIVAMGDVNDIRWLFRVENNRRTVYKPQPRTHKYIRQLSDQSVRLASGGLLKPYEVKAGEWMKITDLMPGLVEPLEIGSGGTAVLSPENDPRMVFIESVTYDAPYTLSIEGNKTGTLAQRMAKIAVIGMAA